MKNKKGAEEVNIRTILKRIPHDELLELVMRLIQI
jgi:hypothetical protein